MRHRTVGILVTIALVAPAFTDEITVGGNADQKTTTIPELAVAPKAAAIPETRMLRLFGTF